MPQTEAPTVQRASLTADSIFFIQKRPEMHKIKIIRIDIENAFNFD